MNPGEAAKRKNSRVVSAAILHRVTSESKRTSIQYRRASSQGALNSQGLGL